MRILFIGDIVGAPGRQIVHDRLADTITQQRADLVIANCENAASGFGITPRLAQELFDEGIHVLTGGNHIFDRREILEFFPLEPRLLRPANFPASNPGSGLYLGSVTPRFCSGGLQAATDAAQRSGAASFAATSAATSATLASQPNSVESATAKPGANAPPPPDSTSVPDKKFSFGADSPAPAFASAVAARATTTAAPSAPAFASAVAARESAAANTPVKFAVLNLQGRVFMAPNDCPFKTADRELARIPSDVKIIFVDMHAEATSEKIAMGWYLDGRVTAVVGTHTHVASADERILPGGTAHITDVGMTGPHAGVIGMAKDAILQKFLEGLPTRFSPAEGDTRMNCVLIDVHPEEATADQRADTPVRKASAISRLCLRID